MNATQSSTISVGNLCKWFTIMTLFVVCGCLFIHVRSQQVTKKREIAQLIKKQNQNETTIQRVQSEIKTALAPGILEEMLHILDSPLEPIAVEETEELSPSMTVSR